MKNLYSWFCIFGLILAFIPGDRAFGGGFNLKNPDINGLREGAPVNQKSVVELCYSANEYFFSGRGRGYSYLPFMINQPLELQGSVGRDGENRSADVRKIKKALKKIDVYRGNVDGSVDQQFIESIERFQRNFAGQRADGRIDARGKTLRILNIENAESFFVKLNREKASGTASRDSYHVKDCAVFTAPGRVEKFSLYYSRAPLIIDYPIGNEVVKDGKEMILLNINEQLMVKQLFRDYHPEKLVTFEVVPTGSQNIARAATYLRLNGGIPNLESKVISGESDKPVNFSWHTKPNVENVEFRYRLYPDQLEWSLWKKRAEVDYFFIGIGSHSFMVETRYRKEDGSLVELPVSDYRFILESPFISQPVIYKATAGTVMPEASPELPDIDNIYGSSKALLIGIGDFTDQTLSPLPFVRQDVEGMEGVLTAQGFIVTTRVGAKTHDEVVIAIEDFLASLVPNDRALIYFSTHGFQDKVVKSRAYLAAADCDTNRPGLNCISLENLESNLSRAIEVPVRHLLVVLDTCSAGLGVIKKSPEYKELNVAVEPGAHMITAGLGDQEAEMDVQRQMSTFTYYLTQGLNGEADYTGDGMVTLTELLLYTRYNVAKKTKGAQTPMIGRIKGPGEIVFVKQEQ